MTGPCVTAPSGLLHFGTGELPVRNPRVCSRGGRQFSEELGESLRGKLSGAHDPSLAGRYAAHMHRTGMIHARSTRC
jgi:hypothetical protein